MKYPLFRGINVEKVKHFRIQKDQPIGTPARYPIRTRFPFPVDVSFGKRFSTRQGALRINTDEGIKTSADKIRTKEVISAVGCPVLPTIKLIDLIEDGIIDVGRVAEELSYPVVLKHKGLSGGREMKFINNDQEFLAAILEIQAKLQGFGANREQARRHAQNYFFEPKFEIAKEYRIHASPWLYNVLMTYNFLRNRQGEEGWESDSTQMVTNRGDICVCRKMKYNGVETNHRNLHEGIFFKYLFYPENEIDNYIEMLEDVILALHTVGLDFGFADVLVDRDGRWVISETGSNPGMKFYDDRPVTQSITAQAYLQAMGRIILEKAVTTNFWRPCVD